MEQNTILNNIRLSYSPGAYGKFIRLILHEGYNNEYVKVKNNPEEIVFPANDEIGYRAFYNESVNKELPPILVLKSSPSRETLLMERNVF